MAISGRKEGLNGLLQIRSAELAILDGTHEPPGVGHAILRRCLLVIGIYVFSVPSITVKVSLKAT